jgi:microcompartment protein PduB
MQEDLINQVLQEVLKRAGAATATASAPAEAKDAAGNLTHITEYVGCGIGDTECIVIANLDPAIHKMFGFDVKYRSIGVIGGRTGAGPQLMAADEAIKATNTEVLLIEMPRDTKGGAGHGNLIVLGAEDVSDARRAMEVTLQSLPKYFGDVYANSQGYTENQYSARASKVLNKAFGVPEGKAFGLILGAPAVIGMLMIDTAVKAADVEVLGLGTPKKNTSFSNEVFIWVTGDSGAVRQAVIAGREIGNKLLCAWGEKPKSLGTPYI